MVDESSRPRKCAREVARKCFWSRAWQARASEKHGLGSAQYPVDLAESFLKVIREDFRGDEELSDVAAFSAEPSQHMKIVWQRTLLSTTCVAECLQQRDSRKADGRKSSGAVAWAFGSPSFARTWMHKEPRQCPCVGSAPTRVMRVDQTTGLDLW